MNLKNLDIKKNMLLNLYCGNNILKENCLIVRVIKDRYFSQGLIVYIHKNKKQVVDLHSSTDLYFLQ